jgi:reductive dehalogenase
MDFLHNLVLSIGSLFALLMLVTAVVFFTEKQFRAVWISLLFFILIPFPFFFSALIPDVFLFWYDGALLSFTAVLFVMFLYNPKRNKFSPSTPTGQNDERNTMFSRRELKSNTPAYREYYNLFPQHEALDSNWRQKPGLMSPRSVFYNPVLFAAAEASYKTKSWQGTHINGNQAEKKVDISPEKLTRFVKSWMKKQAVADVGVASMKSYHYYHTKGRGVQYNAAVKMRYAYGIALTMEMDENVMQTSPKASVLMESAEKYLHSGISAIQLAAFLRELGFNAQAHIDGNYEVVCPLVARDAGLGEIGRMGLLMTPKHGPRVRIAVVTTDAPLIVDKPSTVAHRMIEFCYYCKKCAAICPGKAIPKSDRKIEDGALRWKINSEACFTYWAVSGTDCGRCITVCPYAHGTNFLHRFIRFGIEHSLLFRRLAISLDDLFYGKKPKSKPLLSWMQV